MEASCTPMRPLPLSLVLLPLPKFQVGILIPLGLSHPPPPVSGCVPGWILIFHTPSFLHASRAHL